MLSIPLVLAVSAAYLLLLFMVARHAERRARVGRSLIDNPWVYTLSIAVYCTAWTYFGSVGRAASAGLAFLPIYLGPTLAIFSSDDDDAQDRHRGHRSRAEGLKPCSRFMAIRSRPTPGRR